VAEVSIDIPTELALTKAQIDELTEAFETFLVQTMEGRTAAEMVRAKAKAETVKVKVK
jgi:hypothetical protein